MIDWGQGDGPYQDLFEEDDTPQTITNYWNLELNEP